MTNVGRMIEGPGDLGYDRAEFFQATELEIWLRDVNDDAQFNSGAPGNAARAILRSSRSIVAREP